MIVVGIDYSSASRAALEWARQEARVHGSPVLAVHVGPAVSNTVEHAEHAARRRATDQRHLREFVATGFAAGKEHISVLIADGLPGDVLCHLADDAEMLVVSRRGLGAISAGLLGSVGHAATRLARCPVAVVPGATVVGRLRRIVVGADGSDHAMAAVRWASAEAARHVVPLLVVHAVEPSALHDGRPLASPAWASRNAFAEGLVADVADKVRADIGGAVEVTTRVSWRAAGLELIEVADRQDLLVVGTRGRGALSRVVLGSTSATCLERAACPVVVLPRPQ